MTTKQHITDILDKLPENCTLEDVQYQLYVVQTIRRRRELARDESNLAPHQEARRQLGKWLKK